MSSDNPRLDKRLLGQYFTISNPFDTVAFYRWLNEMPFNPAQEVILEPFAGANNIPAMLKSAEILNAQWNCFDIQPGNYNHCPEFPIVQQDTLAHFPQKYKVCITNPPYLSKNSATRRGLAYPDTCYDDLYKLCLDVMLQNVAFVAAIVPETFLTAQLFTRRLQYVVSLTCKMFDDTECPVCLALFSDHETDDFVIYDTNECLGSFAELSKQKIHSTLTHNWTINDPNGEIGIHCIDGTTGPSISFCDGSLISAKKIKFTSRSITRVSGLPDGIDIGEFVKSCNSIMSQYREKTKDVFLASFKGLRGDGKYRRRLDFFTAKEIMTKALEKWYEY